VKVLFDNCTPPRYASTFHGFIEPDGHEAYHIKDMLGLPNGRHSKDLDWIEHLRESNDEWMFVTGDGRVLKNPAERAALRSAGLHGFVLAPGYQTTPMHQVASLILWRWPEILQVTKLVAAPAMHEIPMNRSSKLRSLPM
jgi:hypothetical protein